MSLILLWILRLDIVFVSILSLWRKYPRLSPYKDLVHSFRAHASWLVGSVTRCRVSWGRVSRESCSLHGSSCLSLCSFLTAMKKGPGSQWPFQKPLPSPWPLTKPELLKFPAHTNTIKAFARIEHGGHEGNKYICALDFMIFKFSSFLVIFFSECGLECMQSSTLNLP